MITRYKVKVTGRVQGVGFRHFCRDQAEHLGVTGWVRNEPDGSVTLECQSNENSLSRFENIIHKGPRFSKVEQINKKKIPSIEKEDAFIIQT